MSKKGPSLNHVALSTVAMPMYVAAGVPFFEKGYRGPLMTEGSRTPPNPASDFVREARRKMNAAR